MSLHVRKRDAKRVAEHGVSTFLEYDLPFKRTSVGISEINGRYPSAGFDVDTKVEAVWYVLSGTGTLFVKGEAYQLDDGDMVMIPKNEKYWIQGNYLKLVVVSSPPWTPQQHKHVDE